MNIDPLRLAQDLIACPSITPTEAGALDLLERILCDLGFTCHRLAFGDGDEQVDNLYARHGTQTPNLCFAGHTDVVPPGDLHKWQHPPFSPTIINRVLYGRGAVDMKTAIACFISACSGILDSLPGSISLLITGDEEGPGTYGTQKVLKWLKERGESIDACIVGEPTSKEAVGDMIKIGRRGSLEGQITLYGKQGHVAYPHLADNPVPRLLAFLRVIHERILDKGTPHFSTSNLEITSIDVGNPTTNVIPDQARAQFNIRFNPEQTGKGLENWLQQVAQDHAGNHELKIRINSEPFQVESTSRIALCTEKAIREVTGLTPEFSTSGGTSDARFIHKICPVIECGLLNQTAHQVDECVSLADIETLTQIYSKVLRCYTSAESNC